MPKIPQAERNRTIRKYAEEGYTDEEIAEHFGLSRFTVANIRLQKASPTTHGDECAENTKLLTGWGR